MIELSIGISNLDTVSCSKPWISTFPVRVSGPIRVGRDYTGPAKVSGPSANTSCAQSHSLPSPSLSRLQTTPYSPGAGDLWLVQ